MFDAAIAGDLKAMTSSARYVADIAHVAALDNLEVFVCQEIFENERPKFADVVLPAPAFLEKEGTFINTERRFQIVEPAIDPPGEARTDFEIIGKVWRRLGHETGWGSPWDALDDVARLTLDYAGVSRDRLGRGDLQWPVAARRLRLADALRRLLRPAWRAGPFRHPAVNAPGDAATMNSR